jgi:WD40 repeat protein
LWHGDGVLWASFSHDSRRLVTAGEDFVAYLWEVRSGKQLGLGLSHGNHVSAAAFSFDGKWVATASGDHTARVWDTDWEDPLTPPLLHPTALTGVVFLASAQAIATLDRDGNAYVWPLTVDSKPVDDLSALARLLASTHLRSPTHAGSARPETQLELWNRLREKYRDQFQTTTNEVIRWHQHQAQTCEANKQWAAAVFHLEYLIGLEPDDSSLKERLTHARQNTSASP